MPIDEVFAKKNFLDRIEDAKKDYGYVQPHISLLNKSVLEIGSGYGGKCVFWKQTGARKVTGVEITSLCVERAKNFLDFYYKEYENDITYICANAESLAIPDHSIDLVIMHDTFEHLSEPDKVLRECHRVLKPEGLISIVFPHYHGLSGNHLWNFFDSPLVRYLHLHLWAPEFLYKKWLWANGRKNGMPEANMNWEFNQYKTLNKYRVDQSLKLFSKYFKTKHFDMLRPCNPFLKKLSQISKRIEFFSYAVIYVGIKRELI